MSISERGNRIELETQVEFLEVDGEENSTNVEQQNSAMPSTITEDNSTVSTGICHLYYRRCFLHTIRR